MTGLSDPHPIEAALRDGAHVRQIAHDGTPGQRLAAADWLRDVACLLWDNLPKCEQCGGKGETWNDETTDPFRRHYHIPCPPCHGSGKLDPAEHLRGMIALWAAVHHADWVSYEHDRGLRALINRLQKVGQR